MNDEIRNYLKAHGAAAGVVDFSDDESLLEAGIIDSMTMVDVITFLEATYEIVVDEDEMTPENFDTVEGIVAYVTGKQGGPVPSTDRSTATN